MRDVKPTFRQTKLSYARPEGPPDLRHLESTSRMSMVMAGVQLILGAIVLIVASVNRPGWPAFVLHVVGLASIALSVVLFVAGSLLYRSSRFGVPLHRVYAWSQLVASVLSIPLLVVVATPPNADNFMYAAAIPGLLSAIYPASLFVSFRDE